MTERSEVVETGWPMTQLLACTTCGGLVWDIDKHYSALHPYWTEDA